MRARVFVLQWSTQCLTPACPCTFFNPAAYYKPDAAGGSVPYLPVLVGIVIAVLATTVVVVQQTSTV